jgi:hypothetical protein
LSSDVQQSLPPTASKHLAIEFVAGDDWEIDAVLADADGAPYDLTSATVLWTMVDRLWAPAIDKADVVITITDAVAGKCMVQIPATVTTLLDAGAYMDFFRISNGVVMATLLMGFVYVTRDPWKVATPAVTTQSTPATSTVRTLRPRGQPSVA